jgi:quinoprotein glucose dehydrogenase
MKGITRLSPLLVCGILVLVLTALVGWKAWSHRSLAVDVRGGALAGWGHYGGDAGGARYSALDQIRRGNVSSLEIAWTYRTGDVSDGSKYPNKSSFEATPILFEGTLYLSTPFSRVIALDPETGMERWAHDPEIDLTIRYSESLVSRGVVLWRDPNAPIDAHCSARIFFGTLDARLIALDARTGQPCSDFGEGGEVDLKDGVGDVEKGMYEISSPPIVVGDVVIVGSAMGDNRRVEVERGTVRGFDTHTGAPRWAWDPIPRTQGDIGWEHWSAEAAKKTGAANAWAPLSADLDRGLIFIPTGSAAPDFYGGERPGDNRFANSVVALRAETGEMVWHFQVVHHDLWDYDVSSQPTLTNLIRDGRKVPAVVQATKMGHLFVLHRETGDPLFPVEERAVPRSDVPGETAHPTQPFPVKPPQLLPERLTAADAFGLTPYDRSKCREQLENLRHEGIFTPPTVGGSLQYPSMIGGVNWGGVAIDRERRILVTNINRLASWVRLIPREQYAAARKAPGAAGSFTAMEGTPYGMNREPGFVSPFNIPCTKPPWGELVAVDLDRGEIRWRVPLGTIRDIAPLPLPIRWGTPNLGGPIATAGGVIFIGAAMDNYLRAFDVDSGEELWKGRLPAGGQATPMTYRLREGGKQYVVIAAGGHGGLGTTLGDYVVAFALRD